MNGSLGVSCIITLVLPGTMGTSCSLQFSQRSAPSGFSAPQLGHEIIGDTPFENCDAFIKQCMPREHRKTPQLFSGILFRLSFY